MRSNSTRVKVVIFFPESWLPYSPTVMNLANLLLEDDFDVKVYWIDDGSYSAKSAPKGFNPIRINKVLSRSLAKLRVLNLFRLSVFFLIALFIKNRASHVIGVDSRGYLPARIASNKPIFLSLEIQRDAWFSASRLIGVKRLVTQNSERAKFLFPEIRKMQVSYLPNSPIIENHGRKRASKKPGANDLLRFIYFGNIIASHGVEQCIEGVLNYDNKSTIVIHGPITEPYSTFLTCKYNEFIDSRVFLRQEYIDQASVCEYLCEFHVGFVMYDFELIGKNDFNYISCPSGKMFNYLASGLPVIGADIIGTKVVEEFAAGVLVKQMDHASIAGAIKKILISYDEYRENAWNAAKYFDFRSHYRKQFYPLLIDAPA